ncbi:MAG: pectate lyase [Bacteroidales bacterium]|nr:pectate lyase [Bacteroidales bacterium]
MTSNMRYPGILCAILAAAAMVACGKEEGTSESGSLTAPTGVKINTQTNHSAVMQWDKVDAAEKYEWKLEEGGSSVQGSITKNTNAIIDKLSEGHSYAFSVRSLAGESVSDWSSSVSIAIAGGDDPDDSDDPDDPDTPASDEIYAQFGIPSVEEDGVARAFPGAEGGGMYTTGGRGGKVIHVTTLSDSGEGSLRSALAQSGARIIVFDVAGIIELASDLKISKGDVTIAGQTAPGDGICLKNYSVYVGADNVIIRFLRFRLGDEAPWTEAEISAGKADSQDAIWGRYQSNIILDHCSMSWSIDETASFYANANMTMQWCMVAESMSSCRLHSKGDHGYGGIWGGKDASFHHNLLAHHSNRTPRFDHQYLYDGNNKSTDTYRGNVDYRNCVNYNYGSGNGCYGGEGGHFNLVNNYYKAGPSTTARAYFMEADGGYKTKVNNVETEFPYEWAYLYLSGNYNADYPSGNSKYPVGIYWKKAYSDYSLSYDGHVLTFALSIKGKDNATAYTTTHSAQDAMTKVCQYSGASLKRDAVDTRIGADVAAKTGKIVTDMASVQTAYGIKWPDYTATSEELANVVDSDGDGMPDWFEDKFGLDKNSASDGAQKYLDKNRRYTNLEMYLHYLVKDIVAAQNEGGSYTSL